MMPSASQQKLLDTWLNIYRFVYNETVWLLNLGIVAPNFMAIKKYLIPFLAEEYPWTASAPRALRDGAVAEACQAVKNAIAKYKRGGGTSKVKFKSRKQAQQSFFLRNDQWSVTRSGFNVSVLGAMEFSEALPVNLRDGRVIKYAGKWWVALPETIDKPVAENQGRLVALDPGIRTFQTFFNDQFAGHLAPQAANRVIRLAVHLDKLISRRAKTTNARARKSLSNAIGRLRLKITHLIDELHWKVARFLTVNFDVILLPTFEAKELVSKAARKIRSQSVRQLLGLAHYRFSQRLEQKAFELGKKVVRVCEAYTSKTASWTGEIKQNLGGAKTITSRGITVERDLNGARGTFLRALVDSPTLIQGAR